MYSGEDRDILVQLNAQVKEIKEEHLPDIKTQISKLDSRLEAFSSRCSEHFIVDTDQNHRIAVIEKQLEEKANKDQFNKTYGLERLSLVVSTLAIVMLSIFNILSLLTR